MTRLERVSITRILTDLIKADNIIDAGEMDMYAQMKRKYNISREIERKASETSLSEALKVLSQSDARLREQFLSECEEMTVSDGFCATQEAILMIAIKRCLCDETAKIDEVFSIHYPDISIDDNQVLYVECSYNETINNEIKQNYRHIYNEFRMAGFNFVYVPFIAKHYQQFNESTFKDVANFLTPNLNEIEISSLIERLSNISTDEFCRDQLCNRLGMQSLRDLGPALLLKINNTYVSNKLFSNFLRIEVTGDILKCTQSIIDEYIGMLSTDALTIPKAKEEKGQFLYHGFYKQLFDMYSIRQSATSTLVVDPYKGTIMLPEVGREIEGMRRKEKALYAMILSQTSVGGVNFNQPKSAVRMKAYNERMLQIKKHYGTWYSLFGGDRKSSPDIENPEIRNPMMSVIRKQINKLSPYLKNIDDYNIRKDCNGNYTVPLDSKLVKLKHCEDTREP